MECQFVVGQKVVCIIEKWIPTFNFPDFTGWETKLNETYTVGEIVLGRTDGEPHLRLKECPRHKYHYTGFRPLTVGDIDISIFTKMLDPKNKFVETKEKEYAFNKYVVGAYRLGSVDAALRRIKERIARMDGSRH